MSKLLRLLRRVDFWFSHTPLISFIMIHTFFLMFCLHAWILPLIFDTFIILTMKRMQVQKKVRFCWFFMLYLCCFQLSLRILRKQLSSVGIWFTICFQFYSSSLNDFILLCCRYVGSAVLSWKSFIRFKLQVNAEMHKSVVGFIASLLSCASVTDGSLMLDCCKITMASLLYAVFLTVFSGRAQNLVYTLK